MELNRDQIIYCLEQDIECGCGMYREVDATDLKRALALIKELTEEKNEVFEKGAENLGRLEEAYLKLEAENLKLTEENERLRDEADRYQRYYFNHCFDELRANVEADVRADTAWLMKVKLKEELCKVARVRDIHDEEECNMDSDDVWEVIDRIAEEVAEGVYE